MKLLNYYIKNGRSEPLLISVGDGSSIDEGKFDIGRVYLTESLSGICLQTDLFLFWVSGRGFTDKVDRLKLAEIVKQVIEEQTTSHESQ